MGTGLVIYINYFFVCFLCNSLANRLKDGYIFLVEKLLYDYYENGKEINF